MSVHASVRKYSWRNGPTIAKSNSGRIAPRGDVDELGKRGRLQLQLAQSIVPRSAMGNITWKPRFGAFQLEGGDQMVDIYDTTPDVFMYQGRMAGDAPQVGFPGTSLLALSAQFKIDGKLRIQLPTARSTADRPLSIAIIEAVGDENPLPQADQFVRVLLLVENIPKSVLSDSKAVYIDIMMGGKQPPNLVYENGDTVSIPSSETRPQIVIAFNFKDLAFPPNATDTYMDKTLIGVIFENRNPLNNPLANPGPIKVYDLQNTTWTPLFGSDYDVHCLSNMYVHVMRTT